jgi:medium-chain acyl-[acyl-carrier-protein] hydrolase
MLSAVNYWFTCPQPQPTAKLRLFCFAYAGGGASVFREWSKLLPADIEVWAVQLPGRETRLREPAIVRLQPLVEAVSQAMLPMCNKTLPFALFGHSMGGLVSFEVARYLRRYDRLNPVHLFVSGARAPHISAPHPPIHALPQPDFLHELKQFNGTPIAVLENTELMELLLPTLRADFELLETYTYTSDAPLSCPISAFGGTEDLKVCWEHVAAWKLHTTSQFSLHSLPGDHFFLHSARSGLLNNICEQLRLQHKSCDVQLSQTALTLNPSPRAREGL